MGDFEWSKPPLAPKLLNGVALPGYSTEARNLHGGAGGVAFAEAKVGQHHDQGVREAAQRAGGVRPITDTPPS